MSVTKECLKEYKKLFPALSNARVTVGSMEGQRLIVDSVKQIKGELYVVARKPGKTATDHYKVETLMAEHLFTESDLARYDALVAERAEAAAKAHAEYMARWMRDAEGEEANAAYEADRWARAVPQFGEWYISAHYASATAIIEGASHRKASSKAGVEPVDYAQQYRVELYINRRSERIGSERRVTYDCQVNWSAIGSVGFELATAYARLIDASAQYVRLQRSQVVEQMEAKAAEAEAKYAQQ